MSAEFDIVGDGSSADCLSALAAQIERRSDLFAGVLVTGKRSGLDGVPKHLFLLVSGERDYPTYCIVRSGFTSGYGGEGPSATSRGLLLLLSVDAEIASRVVSGSLFDRIQRGDVAYDDLEGVRLRGEPGLSWSTYVQGADWDVYNAGRTWADWTSAHLPLPLVTPGLQELVTDFRGHPEDAVVRAFRRVESRLRERLHAVTNLPPGLSGAKLINHAYSADKGILRWPDAEPGDSIHNGRRDLLVGSFAIHRNPRVHHEDHKLPYEQDIVAFLLAGEILQLIERSVPRTSPENGAS